MAEQATQVSPPTLAVPVQAVYRNAVKESAFGLPPAPKLDDSPERTVAERVDTPIHVEKDTDALADEEVVEAPIIESIKPEVNEEADKAKKVVADEEPLEEFDMVDNEEDKEFLKTLLKKDKSEVVSDNKGVDKKEKNSTADLEEKYKPYKEKATEYDAVMSNPVAKAFIEFIKSGKSDPNEFAKEAGFINIDAMTPEQILEMDFKNEGLTEEEISQEMESFQEKSPYEKKKRVNEIKSGLVHKRDEKLKAFTAGSEDRQKLYQLAVKDGMSQLNEVIPKMEGKKYEGMLITSDMANSIKQYVISKPEIIFDEQGRVIGFDIKESISNAVSKLYRDEWKRSLVELGKTLGADKALTARIRPSKKIASSSVIPVQRTTLDDVAEAHANKLWDKRLGKNNANKK